MENACTIQIFVMEKLIALTEAMKLIVQILVRFQFQKIWKIILDLIVEWFLATEKRHVQWNLVMRNAYPIMIGSATVNVLTKVPHVMENAKMEFINIFAKRKTNALKNMKVVITHV